MKFKRVQAVHFFKNGEFAIATYLVEINGGGSALDAFMMGVTFPNPFDAYFYLLENFKEEEIV
jgi:hypothetical protein